MHPTIRKFLSLCVLALLCLAAGAIPPRSARAQPTPAERELHREVQREWRADQWRRHNERFFGPGVIIERSPGEAYDAYVTRIRVRCDVQWRTCSTACATILDPVLRNSCLANCDNDLYECDYGF